MVSTVHRIEGTVNIKIYVKLDNVMLTQNTAGRQSDWTGGLKLEGFLKY